MHSIVTHSHFHITVMERIKIVSFVVASILAILCSCAGVFYLVQGGEILATGIISLVLGLTFFFVAIVIYSRRDPWAEEKALLEKFWWEVFGYRIDWGVYVLPRKSRGFSRLEINPGFSLKKLISDSGDCKIARVWLYRNHNLFKRMQNSQSIHVRPTGPYAFAHRGTSSPDKLYRGASYNKTRSKEIMFMTDIEYLIRCTRNIFEKRALFGQPFEGTVLDVSLSEHSAVWAYVSDKTHIDFQECHKDGECYYSGPREIILADSTLS
ncbi:MAG: hypothetical protein KBC22_00050 [Candidatus Pacebacteria bacterium]|nr:hypothetical protein [Candidatus Paceibacterota bacterium]